MTIEEAIRELEFILVGHPATSARGQAVLMAIEALEQQNGKKFIEIVTEYPAICTYPEYEGKPYFSIRYEENGEKIEGFGTYKLEVLSKYIREYFMGEKKGKWIEKPDPYGFFETIPVCSECGGQAWMFDYKGVVRKSRHCPNCGAVMEESEDV